MIKRTISDRGECWSIFQFPEDKIICQSDLISLMDFILKLNIEEELKCTCDE